jgi:hypothetical protein
MLARTLPSLSVLTSSRAPVLLLLQVSEDSVDCRCPSSVATSPAGAAGAAASAAASAGAAPPPAPSPPPAAAAAAAAAAAGTGAAGTVGLVVAVSTSPKRSAKNTCRPSAEKVQQVHFLGALL